ncbi:MAG TPA: GDSL-type esterase/lipase family protein [Agriterribacter sp.]|nr:GDSL-type esterase/lipase family protein [Agriterribacter sp.]
MKYFYLAALLSVLSSYQPAREKRIAETDHYLDEIKANLQKEWPNNKTINLVFHGHSVPAGYFKTPVVNTLASYPYQVLKALKTQYPYAVINIINTSMGGENSEGGANRFESDVLVHKPDVLFLDYILNDRGIGLEKAKASWEVMIEKSLADHIKIILLTASPDTSVNMLQPGNELEKHSNQVKDLADKYGIGIADSYAAFKQKVIAGDSITHYMSQINHPNEKGHSLIAAEILKYFVN